METFARLHLEKVVKLECNLENKKARNEYFNHLLGWACETGLNGQVDGKDNNLWEVVDVQIEKGFRMKYKMAALK